LSRPYIRLSPETQKCVEILFAVDEQAEAARLLVESCEGLHGAIQLANLDWRDLFVVAGFGDDIT
jgi:hypothetical protein